MLVLSVKKKIVNGNSKHYDQNKKLFKKEEKKNYISQ
jgi:hypothetical protein